MSDTTRLYSKNQAVTQYLTQLHAENPVYCEIVLRLRSIVFENAPEIDEEIKYGGILFSSTQSIGGIYPSSHHISFEFSNGSTFTDPNSVLEGSGKNRRHLKITSLEDITAKEVEFFVSQAVQQ